ncbi:MAG: MATE family efflux transporter [Alloprevotella sp.]|nr:MATE family efflux transporter [Alloprevotella sp.]
MSADKQKFLELGERPVGALLWEYALPAIIAMTASSLYNIIDGIFIGQGVGAEAIMGLALTAPIMSMTAAFGAMVGVGGSTLMSVRLGQRDYRTAQDILDNIVFLNVVMGLGLGLLLQLFLDPILRFFGASEVTLKPAYDFTTIILFGNIITHLYLGMNALLRSTNRPRQAMIATIGTVVINCVLAPLFIFVLDWGIRGAAAATVTSQFLMLCWQLRLFSNPNNLVHLHRGKPRLSLSIMRNALYVGLPQFLVNLCACLVAVLMTRSLTYYGNLMPMGGDVAVGGYGISNRIILFIFMVVIGINQGMQPIAGYNFGAQKFDRLLQVLYKALLGATLFMVVGWLCILLFATPLATLFAKDSPELIAQAAHSLRINAALFPLVAVQVITVSFFQSIGQAGKSIFHSLTRQLLFLVPLVLVLPPLFANEVDGVLAALPVSDLLAFIVAVAMLVWQVRKFKQLIPNTKIEKNNHL